MKQIVCEMCGSTELKKEDGEYICQACGTKYSVEEAKKLMVEIEGKVDVSGSKVDVSGSSVTIENAGALSKSIIDSDKKSTRAKMRAHLIFMMIESILFIICYDTSGFSQDGFAGVIQKIPFLHTIIAVVLFVVCLLFVIKPTLVKTVTFIPFAGFYIIFLLFALICTTEIFFWFIAFSIWHIVSIGIKYNKLH